VAVQFYLCLEYANGREEAPAEGSNKKYIQTVNEISRHNIFFGAGVIKGGVPCQYGMIKT
jgi:hypothetical protein